MLIYTIYGRSAHGQSSDEVYSDTSATQQFVCLTTGVCDNEFADEGTDGSSQPPVPGNPNQPIPTYPDPTTPPGKDCPIQGGRVLCGSVNNPKGASIKACSDKKLNVTQCGHCNACYQTTSPNDYNNFCIESRCPNCGTAYGLDVVGAAGAPVLLPSIGGKTIQWTWIRTGKETIQGYSGVPVDDPNIKYWLQLHHTQPGSGVKVGRSGERGANICLSCFSSSPHVHIQLALGSTKPSNSGNTDANHWLDASVALCN